MHHFKIGHFLCEPFQVWSFSRNQVAVVHVGVCAEIHGLQQDDVLEMWLLLLLVVPDRAEPSVPLHSLQPTQHSLLQPSLWGCGWRWGWRPLVRCGWPLNVKSQIISLNVWTCVLAFYVCRDFNAFSKPIIIHCFCLNLYPGMKRNHIDLVLGCTVFIFNKPIPCIAIDPGG